MAALIQISVAAAVPPIVATKPAEADPPGGGWAFPVTIQLDNATVEGSYLWTLISKPPTSAAVLSNPAIKNPTINADLEGAYIVKLVTNGGGAGEQDQTVCRLHTDNWKLEPPGTLETNEADATHGWSLNMWRTVLKIDDALIQSTPKGVLIGGPASVADAYHTHTPAAIGTTLQDAYDNGTTPNAGLIDLLATDDILFRENVGGVDTSVFELGATDLTGAATDTLGAFHVRTYDNDAIAGTYNLIVDMQMTKDTSGSYDIGSLSRHVYNMNNQGVFAEILSPPGSANEAPLYSLYSYFNGSARASFLMGSVDVLGTEYSNAGFSILKGANSRATVLAYEDYLTPLANTGVVEERSANTGSNTNTEYWGTKIHGTTGAMVTGVTAGGLPGYNANLVNHQIITTIRLDDNVPVTSYVTPNTALGFFHSVKFVASGNVSLAASATDALTIGCAATLQEVYNNGVNPNKGIIQLDDASAITFKAYDGAAWNNTFIHGANYQGLEGGYEFIAYDSVTHSVVRDEYITRVRMGTGGPYYSEYNEVYRDDASVLHYQRSVNLYNPAAASTNINVFDIVYNMVGVARTHVYNTIDASDYGAYRTEVADSAGKFCARNDLLGTIDGFAVQSKMTPVGTDFDDVNAHYWYCGMYRIAGAVKSGGYYQIGRVDPLGALCGELFTLNYDNPGLDSAAASYEFNTLNNTIFHVVSPSATGDIQDRAALEYRGVNDQAAGVNRYFVIEKSAGLSGSANGRFAYTSTEEIALDGEWDFEGDQRTLSRHIGDVVGWSDSAANFRANYYTKCLVVIGYVNAASTVTKGQLVAVARYDGVTAAPFGRGMVVAPWQSSTNYGGAVVAPFTVYESLMEASYMTPFGIALHDAAGTQKVAICRLGICDVLFTEYRRNTDGGVDQTYNVYVGEQVWAGAYCGDDAVGKEGACLPVHVAINDVTLINDYGPAGSNWLGEGPQLYCIGQVVGGHDVGFAAPYEEINGPTLVKCFVNLI